MSVKKGEVQNFICDELHNIGSHVPVPFVHCSAHILSLVINDAAEATVPGITFFGLLWLQFKSMGRTCSN